MAALLFFVASQHSAVVKASEKVGCLLSCFCPKQPGLFWMLTVK